MDSFLFLLRRFSEPIAPAGREKRPARASYSRRVRGGAGQNQGAPEVESSTNKGLQIRNDIGKYDQSHGVCVPQHCPLASFPRWPGISRAIAEKVLPPDAYAEAMTNHKNYA